MPSWRCSRTSRERTWEWMNFGIISWLKSIKLKEMEKGITICQWHVSRRLWRWIIRYSHAYVLFITMIHIDDRLRSSVLNCKGVWTFYPRVNTASLDSYGRKQKKNSSGTLLEFVVYLKESWYHHSSQWEWDVRFLNRLHSPRGSTDRLLPPSSETASVRLGYLYVRMSFLIFLIRIIPTRFWNHRWEWLLLSNLLRISKICQT